MRRQKRGARQKWYGVEERNIRVVEPKRRLCLAEGDLAGDFRHVLVELAAHVVVIAENRRLFELEPDSGDVPRIFQCKLVSLLWFKLMLEQEFFIRCRSTCGLCPVRCSKRSSSTVSTRRVLN
jgi:hypothetical protein